MDKTGIGGTALGQWFMWLAIIGIVLLLLVYGRPFLLPIVVAFLVFTVFSAAIDKVSRLSFGGTKLPYWLAATAGLLVFAVALFLMYVIISGEILLIVAEWPRILERLQGLIATLSEWFGEDLGVAIRATHGEFNIVASIRGLVSPAGFAITAIIVVLLYVAFMFVERSYFPGKVARLFPDPARENQVKDVARQIVKSVHRYLLMKTLLSAGNTLAAYALMKLIGLEFAETWALLTFFLNYIPKIGSITATVVPSVFALLQFQDWQAVLFVAGGLTLVHMVTGEVIEPMLMGRTLNLSSLVIMLALTFWAMVWGIVGTFLAVPLMVVIMIICSKVPMLRPVAILLSSDGDLEGADPREPKASRRANRKAG
jgi:predicted PurR-regulated permease PerM